MQCLRLNIALWVALAALPALANAGEDEFAVWKPQHLHFVYMGRTSRYSCDGLRDKMRSMLLNLGARRDLRIQAIGCEDFGSAMRISGMTPSLNIDVSMPALADSDAKATHPGDSPAPAHFQPFTITSDVFRNMGVGDCELVEDFVHQILPKLPVRNLKQEVTCIPHQISGSHFLVRGEVLKSKTP